jgi:hypothetical protein
VAKHSNQRLFWLLALVLALLIICAYPLNIESHETARKRSPDGSTDAVLMEIPHDAAGAHSYKVCFQRSARVNVAASSCTEIAYLSGVNGDPSSQPVTLVWTETSHLEIRYTNASSVHLYNPVYARRASRYSFKAPIFTKAVQVASASNQVLDSEH